MKYLLTIMIFLLAATIAFGKTIKEGEQEYSCNPVKTCEDQLKEAKAEIKRLKAQLKEQKVVIQDKVVVQEKLVRKPHLVSLITHKTHYNFDSALSNDKATLEVTKGYTPAVTYQYLMENGITPLLGVDIYEKPGIILVIGYNFL